MRSDDDFVIGRFTLAGTYSLLVLGAGVGIIGVGTYLLVESRLVGPVSFRHLTVGLACAAVVGSMLVHASGIDFTQLKPKWLAIGLFVLLPGLFGTFIGPTVTVVSRADSWTARGRRRWLIPIMAIACFPQRSPSCSSRLSSSASRPSSVPATHSTEPVSTRTFGIFIRAAWLAIAVAGLATLVNDVGQLT